MWTPRRLHSSVTGRMVLTPARCPAIRGRWRRRAQRPLPSMMMATWRGSSGREGGGTAAGRGGRCISGEACVEGRRGMPSCSHLEDIGLLAVGDLLHAGDEAVGDLLDLRRPAVGSVDARLALLLHPAHVLDLVAPDVADGYARLLGVALDQLHELLAPLLGERGHGDADELPVVAGVEPQLALLDGLLDRGDGAAVVGRDDQQAGLP